MFKTKKAQGIAHEFPVYVIIGLIVLVAGILLWPMLGKPVWNQLMSIKGMNITSESELGLTPFQIFVKEYKQCKMLPYDDCLCPFSMFTLPDNGFIEIQNIENKNLIAFNYYAGIIKSANDVQYTKLISGCNIQLNRKPEDEPVNCTADSKFVLADSLIVVPSIIPGAGLGLGGDYLNNNKFNTETYLTDNWLFIGPYNKGFLDFDLENPSPLRVYVPTKISGNSFQNNFNLQALYKSGNSILFVPTSYPSSVLNGHTKNLDMLHSKVKECVIPNDFNKALASFDAFTTSLNKCKETPQTIGTDVLCEKFNFNLFKDYNILISPSIQPTITLSYKGTKIQYSNFGANIKVNHNSKFSVFRHLNFIADSLKEVNSVLTGKSKIYQDSIDGLKIETTHLYTKDQNYNLKFNVDILDNKKYSYNFFYIDNQNKKIGAYTAESQPVSQGVTMAGTIKPGTAKIELHIYPKTNIPYDADASENPLIKSFDLQQSIEESTDQDKDLDSMTITNPNYLEIYKCANGDICLTPALIAKSSIADTVENKREIAQAIAGK